jgi:hypothetical protein
MIVRPARTVALESSRAPSEGGTVSNPAGQRGVEGRQQELGLAKASGRFHGSSIVAA